MPERYGKQAVGGQPNDVVGRKAGSRQRRELGNEAGSQGQKKRQPNGRYVEKAR